MEITLTNLQQAIVVPSAKAKSLALKVSKYLKLPFDEISLVFVGVKRMRTMNKKFLGHDYVTDVITFDHGEIVICPAVACANAKHFNNTVDAEILLYVVHGLLHLAGYDDHAPADIKRMRVMEVKLVNLT